MKKAVFFDAYGGDSRYFKRTFKNVFGLEIVTTKEPLDEITASKYKDAEIVSVFVTSKVNAKVVSELEKLEFIATRSTGFDHVDVEVARKAHVLCSTVPSYGEATVAEYTFMLLLTVTRRLKESEAQIESGIINHRDIVGTDLHGKTIGIVGAGKIGRQVARIARGFEMNVVAYDTHQDSSAEIEYVSLKRLLEVSDFLSLHLPATEETKHIIDEKALRRAKKGVVVINTARGELIDTKALINSLYSGHVSGAGLDVVEGEELLLYQEDIAMLHPGVASHDLLLNAEHNVLLRMPNVVLMPHNAFNSKEALLRIRQTTAENIKSFLKHEPQNLVK